MKRVVLIIDSIVAVVAVGVGGFFYYKSINEDKNNPKELFTSYYDDLKNKDYKKMYEYLTEKSKSSINEADFIARNKNIYEGIEATNMEVSIIQVNKISGKKTQIK